MTGVQRISANRSHITVVQIHIREGRIVEEKHETAVVQPGDRIQWTTNWDRRGGPEIRVGGFRRIADLGALTHLGHKNDRLHAAYQRDRTAARVEQPDLSEFYDHDLTEIFRPGTEPDDLEREWVERGVDVEEFDSESHHKKRDLELDARRPEPEKLGGGEWLFEGPWYPPDFRDPVDEPIISAPIAAVRGHWLWSYVWEVRGLDGSVEALDPHIFMHEDPRAGR